MWTDRAGPLPGLYAGLILFAAGAIACAAAATWLWLLGGRLVAGLGAGIVIVAEFVAIGRAYTFLLYPSEAADERSRGDLRGGRIITKKIV